MDEPILVLVLALGVLAVGFAVYRGVMVWRRRQKQWQETAPGLGLTYVGDDPSLIVTYSAYRLFKRGRRQRARNLMRGALAGAELSLADYQYTTGGGKNSSTHTQTVVLLRSPGLTLPHFFVRREIKLLDSLGQMLGGQDIDFPEDEEFSRTWVLQGEDEEATRSLFTLDVRHAFGRIASARVNLEGRGDTLVYHEGRLIAPTAARELLDRATTALEALRFRL